MQIPSPFFALTKRPIYNISSYFHVRSNLCVPTPIKWTPSTFQQKSEPLLQDLQHFSLVDVFVGVSMGMVRTWQPVARKGKEQETAAAGLNRSRHRWKSRVMWTRNSTRPSPVGRKMAERVSVPLSFRSWCAVFNSAAVFNFPWIIAVYFLQVEPKGIESSSKRIRNTYLRLGELNWLNWNIPEGTWLEKSLYRKPGDFSCKLFDYSLGRRTHIKSEQILLFDHFSLPKS